MLASSGIPTVIVIGIYLCISLQYLPVCFPAWLVFIHFGASHTQRNEARCPSDRMVCKHIHLTLCTHQYMRFPSSISPTITAMLQSSCHLSGCFKTVHDTTRHASGRHSATASTPCYPQPLKVQTVLHYSSISKSF